MKLTKRNMQELRKHVQAALRANVQRWDAEAEIERILKADVDNFVDIWGGACACMNSADDAISDADLDGIIEQLAEEAR